MATVASKAKTYAIFFKRGGTVYRFEAINNAEAPMGVEVSAEPGAISRIGPRLPRKMAIRLVLADSGTAGSFSNIAFNGVNPIASKTAQLDTLEGFTGRTMEITGRHMSSKALKATWTVDSVRVVDEMLSDESFVVEMSCLEMIGGSKAPTASVEEGILEIPVPPTLDGDEGDPDGELTGSGNAVCYGLTRERTLGRARRQQMNRNIQRLFKFTNDVGDAIADGAKYVAPSLGFTRDNLEITRQNVQQQGNGWKVMGQYFKGVFEGGDPYDLKNKECGT